MQKLLIRKEAETNAKYGQWPKLRPTDKMLEYGIIVLDKPVGPTSHQATAYAKEILGLSKAGHSGTLDPRVTGVLPIALQRATRVVQTLLPAGKEYVAIMHLHADVAEKDIREAMKAFVGTITQIPPLRSAVKRQARQRKIYYLKIDEIDGRDILFHTGVQAGTYIRKLCHDIGKKLGCGANMAELRRTRAGPFTEDQSATLHDIADAMHYFKQGDDTFIRSILHPVEEAVEGLSKVWVFDTSVDTLCHGARLAMPGISKLDKGIEKGDLVAVMTLKGELICLGTAMTASEEMLGDKGYAVKTSKVFMEPGTYPKQ
ncbi:MAG: RNA-guided pseudouridylation complex pseudouridine synthase subunit Cbf5 [Nanoarchaeota archaeon]|nr:RNA-guided pseudouridylation complex pseudouridine synthase subunit Cbf5 [Nanoarchaeota archaeon]